jgi:glutamyl/glutaminyl-tRNA synthetase
MLLGWHPKDDKELFSIPEMVTEFSIKRVQKAGAIYNPEKLEWFNAMHIKMLDDKELLTHLTPFIPEHWMKDNALLLRAISLSKERLKTLSDFQKEAKYAFELPRYEASLLRWKQTELLDARTHLTHVHEIITHAHEASFPDEALTASIMKYAEEKGRGNVLWPLRVALSGQDASPGPIELLSLLGKEESIERISSALHTLSI